MRRRRTLTELLVVAYLALSSGGSAAAPREPCPETADHIRDTQTADEARRQLLDLAADRTEVADPARNWFQARMPGMSACLADALGDQDLGRAGHARIIDLLRESDARQTSYAIIAALRRAVAARDIMVATAAMDALAAFRNAEGLDAIVAVLEGEDRDLAKQAAVVAGRSGEQRVLAPLAKALQSGDPFLRHAATTGLAFHESEEAAAILSRRLEQEDDAEIRSLIERVSKR